MAMIQASRHCPTCDSVKLVGRDRPNHILHLLLSIITGGLWLIVWIAAVSSKNPWRCQTCGTEIKDKIGFFDGIIGLTAIALLLFFFSIAIESCIKKTSKNVERVKASNSVANSLINRITDARNAGNVDEVVSLLNYAMKEKMINDVDNFMVSNGGSQWLKNQIPDQIKIKAIKINNATNKDDRFDAGYDIAYLLIVTSNLKQGENQWTHIVSKELWDSLSLDEKRKLVGILSYYSGAGEMGENTVVRVPVGTVVGRYTKQAGIQIAP